MGHITCCVLNCLNSGKNSNCKFYRFPTASWKTDKRKRWIEAVQKRNNADGSAWYPKPHDRICSAHFVGGKRSEELLSPSYIPTLFHPINKTNEIKQLTALDRHKRFMERRNKKLKLAETSTPKLDCEGTSANFEQIFMNEVVEEGTEFTQSLKSEVIDDDDDSFEGSFKIEVSEDNTFSTSLDQTVKSEVIVNDTFSTEGQQSFESEIICDNNFSANHEQSVKTEVFVDDTFGIKIEPSPKVDKECQAEIFFNRYIPAKTFICNRYMYNKICDVEIQTEIVEPTGLIKIRDNRKFKDKQCGTVHKMFADQSTETDNKHFDGISSFNNDGQLLDLAGVSVKSFYILLDKLTACTKCTVSLRNRLLLSLMKIKSGLTFSALSVLFGIHRTTVSRIFFSTLQQLVGATANYVYWPTVDIVQSTNPKSFHPEYSDARLIIDCTEFKIEVPAELDNSAYCFTTYKKTFIAKVLIGITPGGFVCFKSKVVGGKKGDSELTVESGLIDRLENGDIILANKGFTEIKAAIDESGKDVKVIMPPFVKRKSISSKRDSDESQQIDKVRIHVERMIERLLFYKVLNNVHENLFHSVDHIVHICCVLINLQFPLILNKKPGDK